MAMRPAAALPLAMLLALQAGCAAKTTADILQVEQVLVDARAAGAAEYAPYELTLAQAYLDKARELWGDSQYEDANQLAAQAQAYAEQAEQRAIQEKTMGSGAQEVVPEEVTPVPDAAPATEPQEPSDDELMDIIQEDGAPAEGEPAPEDDARRPSMMSEEKLDEEQFEEDE